MKKGWVYDEENLLDFHCTVFHRDDEYRVFEISKYKNQHKELKKFVRNEVSSLWGFNNHFYDDPIMERILKAKHITANELYEISQYVIANERNYAKLPFNTHDIFKTLHFDRFGVSLKWCEFQMDSDSIEEMPVKYWESVDSRKKADMVINYCKYDTNQTKKLILENTSALELRTRAKKNYGFWNAYSMSNTALGKYSMLQDYCRITGDNPEEVKNRRTHHDYIFFKDVISDRIVFKTEQFQAFLKKLKNKKTNLVTEGFSEKIFFDGVYHTMGKGGLHGTEGILKGKKVNCNKKYIATETKKIWDWDKNSFYPLVMSELELAPKHLDKDVFLQLLRKYTRDRLVFKSQSKDKSLSKDTRKTSKDKSGDLKIKINSLYGLTGDENSPFYDLKVMYGTTINGQLILLMFIELLYLNGIHCKVSNTDGALFIVDVDKLDLFHKLCDDFTKNVTNIGYEVMECNKVFIADVNNYIVEDSEGNLKLKGRYVYENIPYNKNSSNRISKKAAVKYLTEGIPVKETIKNEKNIYFFCIGKRAKSTPKKGKPTFTLFYRRPSPMFNDPGELYEQQNTIRYIISNTGGVLKGVYNNGDEMFLEAYPDKRSKRTWKQTVLNKIENTSALEYDIDYNYYIKEALKLVNFKTS